MKKETATPIISAEFESMIDIIGPKGLEVALIQKRASILNEHGDIFAKVDDLNSKINYLEGLMGRGGVKSKSKPTGKTKKKKYYVGPEENQSSSKRYDSTWSMRRKVVFILGKSKSPLTSQQISAAISKQENIKDPEKKKRIELSMSGIVSQEKDIKDPKFIREKNTEGVYVYKQPDEETNRTSPSENNNTIPKYYKKNLTWGQKVVYLLTKHPNGLTFDKLFNMIVKRDGIEGEEAKASLKNSLSPRLSTDTQAGIIIRTKEEGMPAVYSLPKNE